MLFIPHSYTVALVSFVLFYTDAYTLGRKFSCAPPLTLPLRPCSYGTYTSRPGLTHSAEAVEDGHGDAGPAGHGGASSAPGKSRFLQGPLLPDVGAMLGPGG